MELLSKTVETVTEATYVLQHPIEGVIYYKEWLDERGKVIDSIVRSKHGHEIDDTALIHEIWEMVDQLESK